MDTASEVPKRPRFLTIDQVAEELSVGSPTVRQLLKAGELRGMQVGGRAMWRIASKDLEDFIERAYGATAARIASGEVEEQDA